MCVGQSYQSDLYILNAGETNGNGSSSAVLFLRLFSDYLTEKKIKNSALDRDQYFETTYMRILSTHEIRNDDDLKDICVDRFATITRIQRG